MSGVPELLAALSVIRAAQTSQASSDELVSGSRQWQKAHTQWYTGTAIGMNKPACSLASSLVAVIRRSTGSASTAPKASYTDGQLL